ncbi:hypothetical protein EDD85DRAFT_967501 [Armillaria nabsnona]|nr:hypothetical protein EDD85DRAFT_967501 [Armillaria nabsnona]
MDKRYRFRRIKAVELLGLPSVFDSQGYCLKYGGAKYKTTGANRRQKEVPRPKWTVDLDLSNISEDERFKVEVYSLRKKIFFRKAKSQCLGFYEGSIRDILIGRSESSDTIDIPMTSKLSFSNTSLRIFREDAIDHSPITQSADEDRDVDTSAALQSWPSNTIDPGGQNASDLSGPQSEAISATSVEDDRAAAGKVMETAKPNEPSEWISKLIHGIDIVKGMIDAVKDVHPAASIAWGFVSICVSILKQQTERDETVLRLYKVMIETYKEATDDHQLWGQERLKPIYKLLFQTTNECRMLIEGYMNKNRLKHIVSLDVTRKAKEFIQGFANLREQLNLGVAKDALVVTLGVRAKVDVLAMRSLLQELKLQKPPGPKPACMPGTRMETIKSLMSWIAECDDNVLWCSGLAGTGKSSLVSTLYNSLSYDVSSRDRIAAFIRYDRTLYSDSSELITSIAYSLGMFNRRIGDAIAKALEASPAAAGLPPSEPHEGPLVVIIDGLDESDVLKELLEVLADGFGPELPFMRLIISSRPKERIARVFKNHPHLHHYPLDTSSNEVKQDIQYFIWQRFTSIDDESVWGTHNKEYVITSLAERASGLFIWAATVCSFLCEFPCLRRLDVLLQTMIPADAMEALTILYQTALDAIVSEVPGTKKDVQRCICAVFGALIVCKSSMTLIVAKLGSVVQERSNGSLELIHKSFDDFLQDHGRCGDGWFIDVKEHEQELARRCVSSLTSFLKNWTPTTVQLELVLSNIGVMKTIQDHYRCVVPSHIGDYAVNVLKWHLDAFVELGINTCCPLFDRYFLFWLEIMLAFNSLLPWHEVISVVNAEVTDQSLRTYVYHAFTFWKCFTGLSAYPVNPAHVYTHLMTISPSANFICRDWGQSSGVNIPFDKERLLALTPCRHTNKPPGLDGYSVKGFSIFRGSRCIQYNFVFQPGSPESRHRFGICFPGGSLLFDVDMGRILDQSPLILCSPEPFSFYPPTSYKSFYASVQTVRFVWWEICHDKSEYSFDSTQYEIIDRHDGDPQDAMISNVDNNNNFGNRTDNSITLLSFMFISIANTQTPSHCDNYLLHAIGSDCAVEQYAHGLIIVDKHWGLMLKVEPGTTSRKEWMTLDGGANGVHVFTVLEDGSRLLGLMGATGKISLREWETSADCPDFKYDPVSDRDFKCQISPDGSMITLSHNQRFSQTYLLGIMPGSSVDIMDLKDMENLAWFPDSKQIAYLRSWRCDHEHEHGDECYDLVVQCLASGQITTIHRWYSMNVPYCKVSVTPDGARVITLVERRPDRCEFWTWDVSDL